ncbi:2-oxoglutarate and iron-dependent oxygenase JMJD4 homolog [Anopheles nili]|uniref:2-oxoglutarate and iron-dependent oxygenase JMJD4 homolog n=1 Tax=Anopheles nili TaxID=185578 RepID=UPI00237BCC20|nr:2-oxoglutarate and iron-dependent oxygenase JMJD4 homolog [Anopheles nili]
MDEIEILSQTSTNSDTISNNEEIERVSFKNISYDYFFHRFMQCNRAVVVESVADEWECYKRWIDRTKVPPRLNVTYLKEKLLNVPVPVADCGKQHYNTHEKIQLALFDFLNTWETEGMNDHQTSPLEQRGRYYLKDWHLRSEKPEYSFYRTPDLFASDWLNEYLVEKSIDDYRFVYMGPKGTWTGFHADVFGSYSWSVNIFGRKLWYLLPPGEEQKLLTSFKNLPFSVTEEELKNAGVNFFSIHQEPGEAVFIPSGWYHQVLNVEDAISVNHNWFNGCNVAIIWNNLRDALKDVCREIDDCRDMENFNEHCQLMLKASFGMDYTDFFSILSYICDKRLCNLHEGKNLEQFDKYVLGKRHLFFDLIAIHKLLSEAIEMDYLTCYPKLRDMTVDCLKKICLENMCLKD